MSPKKRATLLASATDVHATLVTLPRRTLDATDPDLLGPDSLVGVSVTTPTLLLTGVDVRGARDRLARAGIDPDGEQIAVRPARRRDLLDRYRSTARAPAPPSAQSRWAGGLMLLFALALAARLTALDTSYDVFVDELYYTDIARNLATGHGPTFQGELFALHPPALFVVLAAVMRCTDVPEDPLLAVLGARPVVAVTGAALVVAVTALLHRTVRPGLAWAAGLLLIAEPFLNRFDSRVMLETQATCAAAAGMLVLAHTPATPRGRYAGAVMGGLLFALAVTTKDWYVLVTVAPALALGALSTGTARRTMLIAAAVTAAGYAAYVGAVVATGGWPAWRAQKLDGMARAMGLVQPTGFHRPEATSGFTSRLLANAGQLGVTCFLIAFGSAAVCWLLWRLVRRPWLFAGAPGRLLVAVWAAFALPALLYSVLWGTCEEQMFYPLPVMGTAALAVTADILLPRGRDTGGGRRQWVPATVGPTLLLAALVADAAVWTQVHTRQDDAYRRLIGWTSRHLPPGTRVAVTEETPTLLLPNTVKGAWSSVSDLASQRADYLLLSTTQVAAQGSAAISPGLLSAVKHRARPAHTELGPTNGALRLYDVRGLTADLTSRPRPSAGPPPPVSGSAG